MPTWISFHGQQEAPPDVVMLGQRLGARMPYLTRAIAPDGGLRKRDLIDALDLPRIGTGLRSVESGLFGASVLDVATTSGVAISVQTGRAKTNNEAILAILGAASQPDVSWAALILPSRYKGSSTAAPVERDLRDLAASAGVSLRLSGVLILTFGDLDVPEAQLRGQAIAATLPSKRGPDSPPAPELTDGEAVTQLNWTRDEILLACDLVRQNDWAELRADDARVKELSGILQAPFAHPFEGRPPNFRNANSVSRKTADIMTKLPHYTGKPTKGGRLDKVVLDAFLADPHGMAEEASALRRRIVSGEWGPASAGALSSPSVPGRAVPAIAAPPPSPTERTRARPAGVPTKPREVDPASPEGRLAQALIDSERFAWQQARSGRHALRPDLVYRLLATLLEFGGRASASDLAASIDLAGRSFEPTLAALRRLLNVDGFPVISADAGTGVVRVDRDMLRDQFGLQDASSLRG